MQEKASSMVEFLECARRADLRRFLQVPLSTFVGYPFCTFDVTAFPTPSFHFLLDQPFSPRVIAPAMKKSCSVA